MDECIVLDVVVLAVINERICSASSDAPMMMLYWVQLRCHEAMTHMELRSELSIRDIKQFRSTVIVLLYSLLCL